MALKIYSQTGTLKATISPDDSSTNSKGIMDDNILTLTFKHFDCISIDVNDYTDFEDERYWAIEKYTPEQKSTIEWEYNLKLYGLESLIKRILVLKLADNENEPVFSLTAPAVEHIRLFVENINRAMNTTIWKVGEVTVTPNLTIDYSGTFINKGLDQVAELAGTEWWIEGTTVNLSRCEHSVPVTLGYKNGLISISKDTNENAQFFTRLFPVGSTRNIDRTTYGFSRLQLPNRQKYVEQNTEYGVIEHFEEVAFQDIYPKRIGTVGIVRCEEKTGDGDKTFIIYYYTDSGLNFDPNDYELPGLVKNVVFQSGELNGRDFEVNYNSETQEFEIITQFPYGDDMQLPGGALIPKPGDEYILYNIRMPNEYYPIAEAEFAQAVQDYMDKNKLDKAVYKAPTDYIDLGNRNIQLTLGQAVRLESAEFFPALGYRLSRISRISRKVNNPLQADIEISDLTDRGKMTALEGKIDQATHYVKTEIGGLFPDVIKSWESTLGTDTNLFSARMTLLKIAESARNTIQDAVNLFGKALIEYAETISGKFLRKDIHDTAEEIITFQKGIEVFGDAVVETLKVNSNAFFMDTLSSEKFTSGFPGGTGWAMFWKKVINAAGQNEKKSVMELDEITVRGVMRVYEFIISQLMGENGTRITSDMMHVHSIDPATKTIYLDTENGILYNPFRAGDILMVSQFLPAGGVRQYELRVQTATVGNMTDGENRLDAITYSNFVGSESDVRYRDVLTRVDSVSNTDRKGIIKTTSVENGAPYMDVLYGMKTDPDNALRARLGRLDGIITSLWGQLKGYGLYAENAYLTGEFCLKTGEDVKTKFDITDGKIETEITNRTIAINGVYSLINSAGWITTAEGNILWASRTEFNALGDRVSLAESSIIQNANNIALKVNKTDFDALGNRMTAAESSIKINASNITLKVNQTDFNILGNRVTAAESSIIQNANSIALKVSQTDFNALGSRVTTAESNIIQNANNIALKVNKADFDALGNRMTAAEASIKINADNIKLKVSQTDFDALGTRVTTTESKITLNENSISATVTRVNNIEGTIASAGWVTKNDGNLLWASKSIENGETIVSKINQTASAITIDAQHIKLEGIVTANSNFKVLLDGSIEANNGKFTGNIQASSGKIGGFTINGGGLTNTPFGTGNEAYIIFRDDPHNVFAGIGTNVLPASSGIAAAARFENKDTSGFFASTNIAMYAAASGASRNWGLFSNAPLMADGFIGNKFGSLDFTNNTWSATDFAKSNILLLYNVGAAKSVTLPDKYTLSSVLGITIDNGFAAMYTFFCAMGTITFTNITGNNMNTESVTMTQGDVLTVVVYNWGTDFKWLKASHFY